MPVRQLASFDVGDQPVFYCTFRAAVAPGVDPDTGALTDPSSVEFIWATPADEEGPTTYDYGTDNEVAKASTGVYTFTPPVIAVSGRHTVRCNGTAGLIAADEAHIGVSISTF